MPIDLNLRGTVEGWYNFSSKLTGCLNCRMARAGRVMTSSQVAAGLPWGVVSWEEAGLPGGVAEWPEMSSSSSGLAALKK
jgi:hypothetical protein